MKYNIFYIGILTFFIVASSCCMKNTDSEYYNNDMDEVINTSLNSELVYYTIKKEYPDLLEQDIIFLKNNLISNVSLDSTKFLGRPIYLKTEDELLENKNPNFFYFFHIKVSQDLARIDIVYKFSPTIRIFLEKKHENNEWIVLNCVTIYHINYYSHKERDLLEEIVYRIQQERDM